MKKLHMFLLLLFAFTTYACTGDDDPGMSSSKGEDDGKSMISWDIIEGVQMSAEYHEDYAFAIIKGEDYWPFKVRMEEKGIRMLLPYSYLNGWGEGIGPFKDAVKVILNINYKELLGEEEVIYAGPSVKGMHWSSGDLIQCNEKGDTIGVYKYEDRDLNYDPEYNKAIKDSITPIHNDVYGTYDEDKKDQLEAFIRENNLISDGLGKIYVTKESKYDVLSLVKILNQRYGTYYIHTVSEPLLRGWPASYPPKGLDRRWWSGGIDEPVFGRYIGIKHIALGQYKLREGITLLFQVKNGLEGSFYDALDVNGNSGYVWEYHLPKEHYGIKTGYEYDPEEFYKHSID